MASNRKYFGQAYADKCYRGSKSLNLELDSTSALQLAERLIKAVNAGQKTIDVAVYATDKSPMKSGERARITVTSNE